MTLTSLTTDFFEITSWALFPKILFGHVQDTLGQQKAIIHILFSERQSQTFNNMEKRCFEGFAEESVDTFYQKRPFIFKSRNFCHVVSGR